MAVSKNKQNTGTSLSADQQIAMYRNMLLSRRLDDVEMTLKRKNQYYFQISGAGHEAVLTATGMVMRTGYDWFYTYYRDRALCLMLGVTPREMLLQGVGSAEDPASGGRQMPSHWGHHKYHVVSSSSPTGTQALQAVGCAEAGRYLAEEKTIPGRDQSFQEDEVVFVSVGDGTTSEGEWWEAVNTACVRKLPVLFMVEDNGYAISVPTSEQTAGGSISKALGSFENLKIEEFDGTDPLESYRAMTRLVQYCRDGKGPALAHAHVTRPYSHSMSDDQRGYRTSAEIEEEAAKDPLVTFKARLLENGHLTRAKLEALEATVDEQIASAVDAALKAPKPDPSSALDYVYSPDVDPTGDDFSTAPEPGGKSESMVGLINASMKDEMANNPRIVVFGEDVADATKPVALESTAGKGGVFKVTSGLQKLFGSNRVFNSPLAEANIVGRAIGMATRGIKPVVEIQFFDYIWPAYHQIRNELSMMRWRSNNSYTCPLVIRVPVGGYLQGGAVYHSQSGAVLFTHLPGLRVVMPSNAQDANGLLKTAMRCDDPVLFLEHKHLYRQPYAKGNYPGADYMVPFGRATVAREGTDVTVITFGALVRRVGMAANSLAKEGIHMEVLDLRSLSPWDREAVSTSVKKTGKVIVAYEDNVSFGYGAEVAAWIADNLFEYLDAPVKRVASLDCPVAYSPPLEDAILPQTETIMDVARELHAY